MPNIKKVTASQQIQFSHHFDSFSQLIERVAHV